MACVERRLIMGGGIDFYWSLLKKGNKTKGRNSVALIKRGVTIIGDAHFVNCQYS